MILLLLACTDPPKPADSPPAPPDTGGRPDSQAPGDSDTDHETPTSFILTPEATQEGTVYLEFTAVAAGATPVRYTATANTPLEITDLAAGRYGLRAWLDVDGDGAWDGIWEDGGEPTALIGVTLPRDPLRLPLRSGVSTPILEQNPDWVTLQSVAWGLAEAHIAAGTSANGFADHYMDEAFSEQIFQWDTCFMTLFGRYGLDAFPVMASLDNFYGVQRSDGYIGRVVDEDDGEMAEPLDASEPMINPPLFAWAEWRYYQQTGDASRLPRVVPILDAYHDWIDANVRTDAGLYYISMLGSGMDNAPRDAAYDGWVDITAQQALGRRYLAQLATAAGEAGIAADAETEVARICADVQSLLWNADTGFFFDLDYDGAFLTEKTLAGIWPLVAGCATAEQAAAVAGHLADPAAFWRVHVFPSTAADAASYQGDGYYWRGGVWAPTNFASVTALDAYGYTDLARAATANHLDNLYRVYDDFIPDPSQLADTTDDGVGTLWELYAPDLRSPGTRWDDTYLGRTDFVGWTGLGPIALLYEQILGLSADAPADTLTWRLTRVDQHGVSGWRFGDQLVDLSVAARDRADAAATLTVSSSDAFTLNVEIAGQSWMLAVPEGESTFTVSPTSSVAATLIPAGPFTGAAILGNGEITAVMGDSGAITHLYPGDLGLDLVSSARSAVVVDGAEVAPSRLGLEPFFAAYAEAPLVDGGRVVWRSFVGADAAVVVQGALIGGPSGSVATIVPRIELRETPHIDATTTRAGVTQEGESLVVSYSDGQTLRLAASPAPNRYQAGTFEGLAPDNTIQSGDDLALALDLSAAAGEEVPFRWVMARSAAAEAAALGAADPLADAADAWASWDLSARCGTTDACQVASANLYAARASSVGGDVPADLTGQFVTNDFPQLYPRDAMMVARALVITGHPDEAWEILQPWFSRSGPTSGEWYARYDALGRAVDGGTGAAFDEPEWDANAYLALLVEQLGPERLSDAERDVVLDALDFLVDNQDEDGLYTEGGIVEWTGRLPGTAMTAWAGLDAGARLAELWGEPTRAADYRAAAGRIRAGLWEIFDTDRGILADQRDGGFGYDTSLFFGPLLGYPHGPLTDRTYEWVISNALAHGDGVRYFEGNDYGQDLFFFTTAAVAAYAGTLGDEAATELVDWMLAFTSAYGLAPERVYAYGGGAAPASPLSWCAAEVALAILRLNEAVTPAQDGVVDPAEYRPAGPAMVDADGDADLAGDPVALYARRDDDSFSLGLVLAGPADGRSYTFYLSDSGGAGPITVADDGQPLTMRSDPAVTPGAHVAVTVDASGCDAADCTAVWGERGVEVALSLGALGLGGPTQVILDADGDLLPEQGALLSDGDDGLVLVTFVVDAPDSAQVNLSGDRLELGSWVGNAVALYDDGTHGDLTAGDGQWATTVQLSRGGSVAYKYLTGTTGDGSWDGVEFDGDNRSLQVEDFDRSGRVVVYETFGVRGATLGDR